MFESGSSFVLTNIDIEGELPVELIPGYFLRRANDVEIAYFKDCIDKISGSGSFPLPNVWCQYEYTFSKERHENNTTFHRKHLPKEKWKYWVVAYNGVNTNLHKLAYIATLLSVDIDFGIDVFFDQIDQAGTIQGYSFMGNQISGFCSNNEPYANAKTLNVGDLAVIGKYFELYESIKDDYEYIDHALKNYYALRNMPKNFELLAVGYFSIIESLITHAPRLTETLDSINHQIGNKMSLLRRRYGRKIEFTSYFLTATDEKIWKKLYGYRSCLAHGGKPDFQGEFQILKEQKNVISFLKENIKELIILALRDPGFLTDLKKC